MSKKFSSRVRIVIAMGSESEPWEHDRRTFTSRGAFSFFFYIASMIVSDGNVAYHKDILIFPSRERKFGFIENFAAFHPAQRVFPAFKGFGVADDVYAYFRECFFFSFGDRFQRGSNRNANGAGHNNATHSKCQQTKETQRSDVKTLALALTLMLTH